MIIYFHIATGWRRSRERIREQDLRAGFERIGEGQIDLCCNGEGERGFFFFTPKLAMEEKVQWQGCCQFSVFRRSCFTQFLIFFRWPTTTTTGSINKTQYFPNCHVLFCCAVWLAPVYLISCLQIWRSSNSHGILESIHPGLQHESSRPRDWGCLIWTWISNTGLKGVVIVDAEMGIKSSQWLGTNLSSQGTKSQIHREMQNSWFPCRKELFLFSACLLLLLKNYSFSLSLSLDCKYRMELSFSSKGNWWRGCCSWIPSIWEIFA